MYEICDEEQTVWDFVQNKCNGKQTCEYKFYEDEPPSNKKYKSYCKGLSRYVIVPYGCSKLAGTDPNPTKTPKGKILKTEIWNFNFFLLDICESCAETGFTKETDCDQSCKIAYPSVSRKILKMEFFFQISKLKTKM